MTALLRQLVLLSVAAALSWWLFLRAPEPPRGPQLPILPEPPVTVIPLFEPPPHEVQKQESASAQPVATPPPAATPPGGREEEPEPDPPVEAVMPAPPPPEAGAPEGHEDAESPAAGSAEDEQPVTETDASSQKEPEAGATAIEQLMADDDLLASAKSELSGEVRKGFSTVFVAAPEDQIAVAKFFGEELVLVPRAAMDPEATQPSWFRVSRGPSTSVEQVVGRPPLEQYRQYRDLFDYEYARLPSPLRDLRRSVLLRSEVYLFAALIPPSEWAAVIGRRREALTQSGRDAADVRRFVIRYDRQGDTAFDIAVQEIVFGDGTHFRPETRSR